MAAELESWADPANVSGIVAFGSGHEGRFYLATNFMDVFVVSRPALNELIGAGLLPEFCTICKSKPPASVLAVPA
jgi:hypothetical protein